MKTTQKRKTQTDWLIESIGSLNNAAGTNWQLDRGSVGVSPALVEPHRLGGHSCIVRGSIPLLRDYVRGVELGLEIGKKRAEEAGSARERVLSAIAIANPAGVHSEILGINAKCCDSFSARHNGRDYVGYVPEWLGEDKTGDYVELSIDIKTGQILNWQQPSPAQLSETFKK